MFCYKKHYKSYSSDGAEVMGRFKRSAMWSPEMQDPEIRRLISNYIRANEQKRAIVDSLGGDYLIKKKKRSVY